MEHEYKTLLLELENTLIGKLLGSGCTRSTYEVEYDKTKVIKIAQSTDGKHQNILEFSFWDQIRYTKHAKWFAPVHYVSENGKYLIMDRAETNRNIDKYPKQIPSFFHDLKYTNYGFIGKKFVCFDYAGLGCVDGLNSRMKKAKWWE